MSLYRAARRRRRDTLALQAATAGASRCSLSDVLPLLENMGVGRRRAAVRGRAGRTRPPVWIHDFGLRHARGAELAGRRRARALPGRVRARLARRVGERRLQPARARRRARPAREVAVLRAYAKYLRQVGIAVQPDLHRGRRSPRNPTIARRLVELFDAALRPGAAASDADGEAAALDARARAGARRGREPRRGPHPARASCARRSATLRTNCFQTGRRRPAEAVRRRSSSTRTQVPDLPAAAADVRDLRLLAARRRRAPARRAGRARRHPLVRPARGLPHRGPRPDEGADGEERGHRAGRREGRLRRRSSPPAATATRCRPEVDRVLPDVHRAACSTSPTTSSAARSCRRREVVRYDGDDPYLVVAADKGTATFSDIANAIAAEYGFWLGDAFASGGSAGLRPQGDGHHRARRVGVGQAPLPRARRSTSQTHRLHRRRHRRHVGRRVRQRHAAVAAHPAASPRSTTGTSSSTPIPIRRRASPSASGCSSCRARRGPTTTRR